MFGCIAQENEGHVSKRAPDLGTVVSAARVPAIRPFNVDLSNDVAVPHPEPRDDGDRIITVVDPFEVSVHLHTQRHERSSISSNRGTEESGILETRLGVEPTGPGRIPDPWGSISNAFDGDKTWQVQPEVKSIKLCDSTSE